MGNDHLIGIKEVIQDGWPFSIQSAQADVRHDGTAMPFFRKYDFLMTEKLPPQSEMSDAERRFEEVGMRTPAGLEEVSAVSDRTPLTWRTVMRYFFEAALAVMLPFMCMEAFGLWQMACPDHLVSADTPAQYKLSFKKLTLHTGDGYDIAAWDVAPVTASDDAILVLPGYASDKGSILPRTAFLGQTHRLLYIDFRSFGESSGKYTTMGLREVEDAMTAVRYLKEQGVKRIGIYGFTMGGAVALMAAARDPAVTAVVTEDAYADFGIVAGDPYGYLGPARPAFAWFAKEFVQLLFRMNVDAVSPSAVASSIKVPVLVIHSRADASVPIVHADILRSRMKDNANVQFWYTDGNADLASRTAFAQALLGFFGKNLAASAHVSP